MALRLSSGRGGGLGSDMGESGIDYRGTGTLSSIRNLLYKISIGNRKYLAQGN